MKPNPSFNYKISVLQGLEEMFKSFTLGIKSYTNLNLTPKIPLMSQIKQIFVRLKFVLKYLSPLRSMTLCCRDKGIRKSEFVL